MVIDNPCRSTKAVSDLAAEALENGDAVIVYLLKTFDEERIYRNWLKQILRERNRKRSDETVSILASGASFIFETDEAAAA